jgi:protocatechuate 3,4-dioxygenase beta subunit
MERRNFIKNSSLIAVSVGIFGKISWNGEIFVGNDPTTTDILGPFYRPGAPVRSLLLSAGTKGEVLHFSGIVYKKDGKTPMSNAMVEIWHCNENGEYDNTTDEYVYRAAWKTSKDGKYNFKTILPVAYKATDTITRPAHIHMRISGNDHQDLITQVYFKGDPEIEKDISASNPASVHRILEIGYNNKKEKVVKFDIVLREEYPLDAEAYKKISGLYGMNDKSMIEFYRQGDQLFMKYNGQIMEALDYKGNNRFEGGLGLTGVEFELSAGGAVKVKITDINMAGKEVKTEGTKMLKYPGQEVMK